MGDLATTGEVGVVSYGSLVMSLASAADRLRGLSERSRSTYQYVEGCAAAVDRLADQMAGLAVDSATVSEHQEAAAVMRGVLGNADAMAAALEELAGLFSHTASAHQADYGSVAAAATSMTVPMADAQFYSNR